MTQKTDAMRLHEMLTSDVWPPDGRTHNAYTTNPWLEAYDTFVEVRRVVDASAYHDLLDVLKRNVTADVAEQLLTILRENS